MVFSPMLLVERAVLLCPALPEFVWDRCINGICLAFGVSPFCVVLAGGVIIEVDIAPNVLQDQ